MDFKFIMHPIRKFNYLNFNVMKKIIISSLLILPFLGLSQGSKGEVMGTVILNSDQTEIFGAKVETESNGSIYRAKTDAYGKFRISAIPPGKYIFSIIYEGDTLKNLIANVPIDGIDNLGQIQFYRKTQILKSLTVKPKEFMSLTYGVAPEIKLDLEQIKKSPQKFDQKAMIASMSSDIKLMDDGSLVFRGARKGDMIYIMDGVKMNDVANVPSAAIGGMMAYTGGIPAKYGDTTGGVVVMESLSYFDLYRNWVSMQLKKQ